MPCITRQQLKDLVVSTSGASAVGIGQVAPVSDNAVRQYDEWIADGCHADMAYLEKYREVRNNPALLLDNAKTIVMAAFSYANPDAITYMKSKGSPLIAEYALGRDYHKEVRKRLKRTSAELISLYGGQTRICVDTAPLRERYWAEHTGLGFVGLNNYLIVPGAGAHFVLGALLWTESTADGYDRPCELDCGKCGACVRACPMNALSENGRLDASRCLSYLTIESQLPLNARTLSTNSVFGCDICRKACPHQPENPPQTNIEVFRARKEVVELTENDWNEMTAEKFNTLFCDSAIKRAGHRLIKK